MAEREYRGPGIYSDTGELMATFLPGSLQTFLTGLGDYQVVEEEEDFYAMYHEEPPAGPEKKEIWTTPTEVWGDVEAPQIGTGRPDKDA